MGVVGIRRPRGRPAWQFPGSGQHQQVGTREGRRRSWLADSGFGLHFGPLPSSALPARGAKPTAQQARPFIGLGGPTSAIFFLFHLGLAQPTKPQANQPSIDPYLKYYDISRYIVFTMYTDSSKKNYVHRCLDP